MNSTFKRVALPIGAAVILGSSGFAFMASNSVPQSFAGDGTGDIAGYQVSNISYNTFGGQVADVSFTLNQPAKASNVEARVLGPNGTPVATYDDCVQNAANGVWRCNNAGPSISIQLAEDLRVVAAQ